MERMEQELGLTAAQKTRVDSIMHRRMKERGVLEDSMRNRMRAFFDSTRAEIDSVLTPAQRTQLREKFPPPGPGAPHGERRPGD
jgi:Spy/CpxP family protein refolding chaperone